MRFLTTLALLATFVVGTATRAFGDELIMFEQAGCPFCQAWDREVGRIYTKTSEAKLLPLRRIDIHAKRPTELERISGIRFTPTFVVLHCGLEIRRITGYPGEEHFWGLLDEAVKSLSASDSAERSGATCGK